MKYATAFEALGYKLKDPRQEWSSLSRSGVCISLWSKELAVRNRLPWIDTLIHARPLQDWGDKPGNHLRIAHLIVALAKFDGFLDVVLVSGTPGGSFENADPWQCEARGGRWRVTRLDQETGHFEAEVVSDRC